STRAVAPSSFESQVSLSFKPQPGAAPVVIPEQTGDNALIDEIARQNARDKGNSTDQLNSSGIDYMERMVAIDIKTLGPNHPSVARDLKGLASVYVNQGRYEQAQPLLERALAIHVAIYGNKSVAAQRLSTLLDLLKQARQSADIAPTLIGELASKNTVPLAAQTLEIAQRLNELAFASYCQGKLEDASAFYAYALDSTLHATGERSLFTAATLKDYERVLRSLGQTSQAEKYNTISRSITTEALAVKLLRVQ
ncbi:MAG: tetratricopeptide repeat protein, partial [Candidatus Obscuribacter sp.]|nr:tetratricopeptide repeat protein [Candidatus Obscuribacter sp.]